MNEMNRGDVVVDLISSSQKLSSLLGRGDNALVVDPVAQSMTLAQRRNMAVPKIIGRSKMLSVKRINEFRATPNGNRTNCIHHFCRAIHEPPQVGLEQEGIGFDFLFLRRSIDISY